MTLIDRLGMTLPIIQAPMAGVSTPHMAAAVSDAGGLGSIAVGAADVASARAMIAATVALTRRAFNVNVFVHAAPVVDRAREAAWIEALRPEFAQFDAEPPTDLRTIYTSFADDAEMQALLIETAPHVVSFHFGLPDRAVIVALKAAGCILFATATNLEEARMAKAAGIDAVVAQGWEAGGHRGMFDPEAVDERLDTAALVRLLVAEAGVPVIAAGGIMDGQDVRAALACGVVAAQLGTAFVACPESHADDAYRRALADAPPTVMTRAISGRPARCLANRFTAWGEAARTPPPAYPRAYDAGKALNAAARNAGEGGYGAQWAGKGALRARALSASDLMATLSQEMQKTLP